ncbi:MAG: hypothetical protein LCH88_01685 [Proteobacteria bacterium]|nr:hypothetical protein [Pseudomonadota bacterium]
MKPLVTVAFGGLSADARLPGWTMPFIVRLADRFRVEAANGGGPALRVVRGDRQVAVVDTGADAFAREFGSLDRPATPRLGPAAARLRSGT